MKLDDLDADDFRYAEDTSSGDAPTTPTPGASVTLPSDGGDNWLVISNVRWLEDSDTIDSVQQLSLDGNVRMAQRWEGEDTAETLDFLQIGYLPAASASAVCRVEYYNITSGINDYVQSSIFALKLDAFTNYIGNYSAGPVAKGTVNDTYVQTNSVSLELDATGDVAWFAQTIADITNASHDPYHRIQLANTDIVSTLGRRGSAAYNTNDQLQVSQFGTISMTSGTKVIDMDCAEDTNTTAYNFIDSALVAFSMDLAINPKVTDVDTNEQVDVDQTNVVITGVRFGASDTGSADVEFGDAATYGGCGTLVSQSRDSWSDTSIQIDVTQGGLSIGPVWVYVTDSAGLISAGFPIQLGPFPPAITDMEDEQLDTAEQDNVLTGTDFLASQGTGKVEISDNAVYASGTKVTQTIDSWANTSIQFDFVQGALANGTGWIWVTTNDGQLSNGYAVNMGPVPQNSYEDEIQAMTNPPQHLWTLQNTFTDTGVSSYHYDANTSGSGSPGFSTSTPLLCRDDTHAFYLSAANQYTSPNEAYDNPRSENDDYNAAHNTQYKAFWVRLDRYHQTPSIVMEEGANVNDMCLVIGFGNILLANALSDTADVQAFSNKPLRPNRNYHILLKIEGSGYDNELALYIDGVRQTRDSGNPWGIATFLLHNGDLSFGWNQQTGTYGQMNIGGTVLQIGTAIGTRYSHWCSWHDIQPTETEIYDTLFELGVGPDETIAGTPAAMQTAIEANDDTDLPDAALTYYVDAPTGASDVTLTLTNQVFHEDTSLHFQWRGGGALTIINVGTSNVDAAKCSNPWGGSITVVDTVPITFTVYDSSGNPIPGVRVAVYKESDDTEVANDTTDESGVMLYGLFQYTTDTDVYFRIRRSSNQASFATTSGVNGSTEVITTDSAHNFEDGEDVVYSKDGGSASVGLTDDTTYYVHNISGTTLSLHTSAADAIADTSRVNLTASGSETHLLTPIRYKRVSGSGTITSSGLSVSAILTRDNIAT
jgi:hypothetical protein